MSLSSTEPLAQVPTESAENSKQNSDRELEFESRGALPERPLVVIQPTRSWVPLNLKDFRDYHELVYFLIWRDVKIRYKQTFLGVLWVIIQPLFTMVIFTLIFGRVAGLPSENIPYPLFAYAGLLPWIFFSNAVSNAGNSMVSNAHLITKVYFPRMIIPAASIGASLLDFAISFVLLVVLMIYYQVTLTWNILMLVPLIVLTTLLALGTGLWMGALNVKYRDIRFALPFVIQLWMFVSPIIYPASFLPPRWQKVLALNPLTGIIEGYRSALFGKPFNWTTLGISAVITFLVLIYASYNFRRMEKTFADIV